MALFLTVALVASRLDVADDDDDSAWTPLLVPLYVLVAGCVCALVSVCVSAREAFGYGGERHAYTGRAHAAALDAAAPALCVACVLTTLVAATLVAANIALDGDRNWTPTLVLVATTLVALLGYVGAAACVRVCALRARARPPSWTSLEDVAVCCYVPPASAHDSDDDDDDDVAVLDVGALGANSDSDDADAADANPATGVVAEAASDVPLLVTGCTASIDYCVTPLPSGAIGAREAALGLATFTLVLALGGALVTTVAAAAYAAGTLTERWQVLLALAAGLLAALGGVAALGCSLGPTTTSRYAGATLALTAFVLVLVLVFLGLLAVPPTGADAQELAVPLYVATLAAALFYACAICCRARTGLLHARAASPTHATRHARRPRRPVVELDMRAFRIEPLR